MWRLLCGEGITVPLGQPDPRVTYALPAGLGSSTWVADRRGCRLPSSPTPAQQPSIPHSPWSVPPPPGSRPAPLLHACDGPAHLGGSSDATGSLREGDPHLLPPPIPSVLPAGGPAGSVGPRANPAAVQQIPGGPTPVVTPPLPGPPASDPAVWEQSLGDLCPAEFWGSRCALRGMRTLWPWPGSSLCFSP